MAVPATIIRPRHRLLLTKVTLIQRPRRATLLHPSLPRTVHLPTNLANLPMLQRATTHPKARLKLKLKAKLKLGKKVKVKVKVKDGTKLRVRPRAGMRARARARARKAGMRARVRARAGTRPRARSRTSSRRRRLRPSRPSRRPRSQRRRLLDPHARLAMPESWSLSCRQRDRYRHRQLHRPCLRPPRIRMPPPLQRQQRRARLPAPLRASRRRHQPMPWHLHAHVQYRRLRAVAHDHRDSAVSRRPRPSRR